MDDTSKLYAFLGVTVLLFASSIWKTLVNRYKLSAIPTVGSSGYIGALRFLHRGPGLPATLQEGYDKYRGAIFKVSTWSKTLILVSGTQLIDELRAASDDELSADTALRDTLQMEFTLGPEISENRYHLDVVRSSLTGNISTKLGDIQDEIESAFNDHIIDKTDEWVTVTAYPAMMDIVCRTINRMLVGLPLCRDPDYLDLHKKFTTSLMETARVLNYFPSFLKPILVPLFREIPRGIERGYKHLEPFFKDRLEKEARYGKDSPEKPNDAISWLVDYSSNETSHAKCIRGMILRMLLINFAALRTPTIAFTYVLFELSSRPEYVRPMREEIETIIQQEGWSKTALGKLRKVDSFIKEILRLSNFFSTVIQRKAVKDLTFSNGVTVPAGSTIAVPLAPTQIYPEYYTDPGSFDGFRFEKMRDKEGMGNKHQLISVDSCYVLFGGGGRACPGRFFATHLLKLMLVHILLHYDVQMVSGHGRTDERSFGKALPDPKAQVKFRKRK
ncbi:Cytochrome P450 [Amanita muscaria]